MDIYALVLRIDLLDHSKRSDLDASRALTEHLLDGNTVPWLNLVASRRESPRDSRRAHSLRGWSPWPDRVGTHLRCESVPCGWSWSTRPSTDRSGRRSGL